MTKEPLSCHINIRLTRGQFDKIAKAPSKIIRQLIDKL